MSALSIIRILKTYKTVKCTQNSASNSIEVRMHMQSSKEISQYRSLNRPLPPLPLSQPPSLGRAPLKSTLSAHHLQHPPLPPSTHVEHRPSSPTSSPDVWGSVSSGFPTFASPRSPQICPEELSQWRNGIDVVEPMEHGIRSPSRWNREKSKSDIEFSSGQDEELSTKCSDLSDEKVAAQQCAQNSTCLKSQIYLYVVY